MGYSSRSGRRPAEQASKAAHGHIISDGTVQAFLKNCILPKSASEVEVGADQLHPVPPCKENPITHIVAVDGGYTEVPVRSEFPSSTIAFFQFGALIFSVADLEGVTAERFIRPESIEKLKKIQRLKFTLPVRNITVGSETGLINSVRRAVYDFFCTTPEEEPLITTLRWLLFEEFEKGKEVWTLAHCPTCQHPGVPIERSKLTAKFTTLCVSCGSELYLTDAMRLHEAVDDELGASGVLGYVVTSIEQLLVFHLVRLVLAAKPSLLHQILFIKDGPLAFFGQTANLHKPARALVKHLQGSHALNLVGLEKSGAFVEHADEIQAKLPKGNVLLLNNDYIYRYVIPGQSDPSNPYGRTTYYSNKVIFKTATGQIYVASLPTSQLLTNPKASDFKNLDCVLSNVEKLRCDMYDNSLIPVALANKLVSLANHPSSKILQKFAMGQIAQ